ncbi:MAG: hypothetical protein GX352_08480 [Clostridiales bacterium]|nr:hypothetical protein [Clostridiales bacterium]
MTKGSVSGRKIKPRFYLFMAAAVLLLMFLGRSIFRKPLVYTIGYGEITTWDDCPGLVVREEKTYKAPDYGKVEFFVSAGESVEKNSTIAILYREGFDGGLVDELYKIESKISDYQNKNIIKNIIDADFETIQKNIDGLVHSMQGFVGGGTTKEMPRLEEELRGLLKRRQRMLDKAASSDDYLEELFVKKSEIETQLGDWKLEISAPEAGIIGFELDGLEDLLMPIGIDYLDPEQYVSFSEFKDDKDGNIIDAPLFKIITSNRWYLLSLITSQDVYFEQGDIVSLKLPGLCDTNVEAKVRTINSSKNSALVIFEVDECLDSVLEIRNIKAEIGITTNGLMIPIKGIIRDKDEIVVKVLRQDGTKPVKVKIRAKDEEWAIIQGEDTNIDLEINDRILIYP